MPTVSFVVSNCGEIALDKTLVAQRTQALKLALANTATGFREIFQQRFSGDLLVECNQFAKFIVAGVIEGVSNSGQFQR